MVPAQEGEDTPEPRVTNGNTLCLLGIRTALDRERVKFTPGPARLGQSGVGAVEASVLDPEASACVVRWPLESGLGAEGWHVGSTLGCVRTTSYLTARPRPTPTALAAPGSLRRALPGDVRSPGGHAVSG